ncbi:Crp/Fnr family transcriptional regulator [Streptomyces sp. URMC 129]|uniref:Crp/Fnr family transcriptional regulator n=1 Tax=Streptomyces sp. URMC 129 TaxID=3423407 RepID=UPI003F1C8A8A
MRRELEPNLHDVLAGRHQMPEGSFIGSLPTQVWSVFVQEVDNGGIRAFKRGEEVPTGSSDDLVHIVLQGCVAQERSVPGALVVRFRGPGEFLGEQKLLHPSVSGPKTTSLTATTKIMSFSADLMRALLGSKRRAEWALLVSLEARYRRDEEIYCTFSRPHLARLSTLLHHLASTVGVVEPQRGIRIAGPRQSDLARALMIGQSTLENTLAVLCRKHIVYTRYRAIYVNDLDQLKEAAR